MIQRGRSLIYEQILTIILLSRTLFLFCLDPASGTDGGRLPRWWRVIRDRGGGGGLDFVISPQVSWNCTAQYMTVVQGMAG